MTTAHYGAGLALSLAEKDQIRINAVIRQLIEGRSNNVGVITLDSANTSTVVSAVTCGPNSIVQITPTTANAQSGANAIVKLADISAGKFYITHASTGQTDQTFMWSVHG